MVTKVAYLYNNNEIFGITSGSQAWVRIHFFLFHLSEKLEYFQAEKYSEFRKILGFGCSKISQLFSRAIVLKNSFSPPVFFELVKFCLKFETSYFFGQVGTIHVKDPNSI